MTQSLEKPTVTSIQASTLVELLRHRASQQPEGHAYTFLIDGKKESLHLTYSELDRQARAIAALLQQYQAKGESAIADLVGWVEERNPTNHTLLADYD